MHPNIKNTYHHPDSTHLEACCSLIRDIVPIKLLQLDQQQKNCAQKVATS